jgi:hypothetical protein
MSTTAHLLIALGALITILHILRLVRLHQLRSKYALLWVVIAALLLPLAVAPGLLEWASEGVGIHYAPTTFLVLAVGFLFLVAVHYSWELSRLEAKVRSLAEGLALLKAEGEAEAGTRHDG